MNQKGISSIAIILIIVGVLVLVGGIWYWQKSSIKETAPTPTPLTSAVPTIFKESGKLSKGNDNDWYLIVRKYNPQQDSWTEEAPIKLKFTDQSLCQAVNIKQIKCDSFLLNQGMDVDIEGIKVNNEISVKTLIKIQ